MRDQGSQWVLHAYPSSYDIIRGVSGLRSVGSLRSDTKRFGDGEFLFPTKRNLNFNNQCIFGGVSGLRPGDPLRRYLSYILLIFTSCVCTSAFITNYQRSYYI